MNISPTDQNFILSIIEKCLSLKQQGESSSYNYNFYFNGSSTSFPKSSPPLTSSSTESQASEDIDTNNHNLQNIINELNFNEENRNIDDILQNTRDRVLNSSTAHTTGHPTQFEIYISDKNNTDEESENIAN